MGGAEAGTTDAARDVQDCILLVDDSQTNLKVLFRTLDGRGYKLLVAKCGEDALAVTRKAKPALILLDVMMPGIDGYEVCRQLKDDPETAEAAIIFLSALGEVKDKVKGLEMGAVDFITKPFQAEEVLARVHTQLTIQRLKAELLERNERLNHELSVARDLLKDAHRRAEGPLLGESVVIQGLRASIKNLASVEEPLLLSGEPGAGEEAVARAIHQESTRSTRAFMYVNCLTLPTGRSSDLFSGAMTVVEIPEAPDERWGKYKLAHGGTLFLDRVEELPQREQEHLIHRLERAAEARANGQPLHPDVRLIAFTSRKLGEEVKAGRFEVRLHELLAKRQLSVPSLGERREDIPVLAEFYLKQQARRLGKPIEGFTQETLKNLQEYRWPGQIKELASVVERAVTLAQGTLVEIDQSQLNEGVPMGGYRLVKKLGAGGMGEVWQATHQLLARPAAIKLIRPEALGTDAEKKAGAVKRFRREAQATAQLRSPHTIDLYDFGVTETGSFYYVMELLDGMDLESMVAKFGGIHPARAVYLLRQACRSLQEAHECGLVHRDIKPGNLFVCKLGPEYDFLKILDFGIVKGDLDGADTKLTAEGSQAGTPGFMAPEVILGKSDPDGRADLYALGCVAYWMLAGKPVFEGETVMSLMVYHATRPPRALSLIAQQNIPGNLEALIMRLLEKDPLKRPQTARELWELLGALTLEAPWTQADAEAWWTEHRPAPAKPEGATARAE